MSSSAYERARHLLDGAGRGAVVRSRALGVVQSLLVLGLLGVAGLLGVLVGTGGAAEIRDDLLGGLPQWVESRSAGKKAGSSIIQDSGLFPLAAANLGSRNPVHRAGAQFVLGVLRRLPALHSNVGAWSFLLALALVFILTLALISRMRRTAMAVAACSVAASLRKQIHRQMYRLGASSLPTEGTGPVVNLFTREVNDIRDGFFTQLDIVPRVPVMAVGLVLFVLLVSWKSTILLASFGILVAWAWAELGKSSRVLTTYSVRDAALHLSALQEDLGLLRIVRVHGMEEVDKARFDEHLDRYTDADVRRIVADGHGRSVAFLLIGSAAVACLGVLAYGVVRNSHTPASAILLLAALLGLVLPIREWRRMRVALRQAGRSSGGVFGYLDRSPELHQAGGAQFLAPLRKRIVFENVSLQSPRGGKLLDGLSLEIKAGSRVAIMSPDEGSKYALACLIPRLIDPTVGRVRIDGIDLRDVTLESVRAQVSTVLQADLVFSDTIFANIALGDASYDLPRVIDAAKLAHAHSFIKDLPDGYETAIGPLGHYLTPDQQYRIGLARAALHDPSIVVIEEPLGDIDEEVKPLLDDTIARLAPGRTLILLPHRLSTIRSCDQVVVLLNGHLEALGTPKEVHTSSKLYRHLQYTEFNQFATGEVEAGQMGG